MTSRLIDTLRAFNRKERYYVFRELVTKTDPRLSSDFADRLEKVIGVRPDPETCFLAVDYHLDWISAAVFLVRSGNLKEGSSLGELVETRGSEPFDGSHRAGAPVMTGSQEDVDALLAFQQDGITHLVFIEAKADTAWSLSQLRSKGVRFLDIFGQPDGSNDCDYDLGGEKVRCHLALLGPDKVGSGHRKMKGRIGKVKDADAIPIDQPFPRWFYSSDEDGQISLKFIKLSSSSVDLFQPRRISGKGEFVSWRLHQSSRW